MTWVGWLAVGFFCGVMAGVLIGSILAAAGQEYQEPRETATELLP